MTERLFFPKQHSYGRAKLDTLLGHEPTTHNEIRKDTLSVIWTPGFIAIFGLIIIVGLGAASVITQGWTNSYYPLGLILILYHIPILVGGIVLFRRAQSSWLRRGVLLSIPWLFISAIYYWITYDSLDQVSTLTLHLQAAAGIALACAYLCLSLAYIPSNRWDIWFFRLTPVVLIIAIGVRLYLRLYVGSLLGNIETIVYNEALYFSLFTWWLRPARWKYQAGPSFLFGLFPLITIIATLSSVSTTDKRFFFMQIAFLALFLGILRLIRQEARSIPAYKPAASEEQGDTTIKQEEVNEEPEKATAEEVYRES